MMLIVMTGCVKQTIATEDPIRIFNREYYAVKDMSPADVWKMKEMMASTDMGASKNAGLLLGRHYVRKNETEKGYKLIKDNLDDSYLDKFMKVSGHLWAYDAAVKANDTERAAKEKELLVKTEMDEKAQKAFKVYCGQEKRAVDEKNLLTCLEKEKLEDIFKEAPKENAGENFKEAPKIDTTPDALPDLPVITEPIKPEIKAEPVKIEGKKKIIIGIQNSVQNPELVEAILYTVSKLKINAELDFSGEKKNYDFVVDAGSREITQGDRVIEFNVDRKKQMRIAAEQVLKSGAKNIAIGYSEGYRDTASEIADDFKNSAEFHLFNIQEKEFQSRLKEIKGKSSGGVSFVLAGTQEQVLKVIPFLRYYSPRPDKTVIAAAVDSVGKRFYSGEFTEYTRNAIVVTDILLAENPSAESFSGEFSKDFGKAAVLSDYLGYDMIVFMEKIRNPQIATEYLTGIQALKDKEVIRKTGAYRIVSGGKLIKIED